MSSVGTTHEEIVDNLYDFKQKFFNLFAYVFPLELQMLSFYSKKETVYYFLSKQFINKYNNKFEI